MLASTLVREARRSGLASTLTPVGSLRRFAPDIGDVALLGITPPGQQPQLVDAFTRLPSVTGVLERHSTSVTVQAARGIAALHVSTPDHAGASLVWHTGSRGHTGQLQLRARKLGLTFHAGTVKTSVGVAVPTPTEESFYQLLELPYVPPELREGIDEVDAAARGTLPQLVSSLHIRGDLHMHSTWSDGRDTIEEMVQTAKEIGYEYVAITDHSDRAMASRTLSAKATTKQREEIEEVRHGHPSIQVLWGVEVDIMRDGSLDFDDETLAQFDIVLASLHDHGGQEPAVLLDRYLHAVAHPLVNVITHPAHRSPAYSDGYDLDFDTLFAAAVETGTALEVDGAPGHLDMDGALARRAVAAGVTVTVDSDCHRKDALARQMRFGLGTARRGWVGPEHVLNARSLAEVRAFIARKRGIR